MGHFDGVRVSKLVWREPSAYCRHGCGVAHLVRASQLTTVARACGR